MAAPFSEGFKAKIVRKLSEPGAPSQSRLAAELGLNQPTVSRWFRDASTVADVSAKKPQAPKRWSTSEKLRVLAAAAELTPSELGEFLRREGLFEAQLREWREAAAEALESPRNQRRSTSTGAKRVKQLERELRRKNKALAEVTALLVLKKKLAALWGDEDDSTDENKDK